MGSRFIKLCLIIWSTAALAAETSVKLQPYKEIRKLITEIETEMLKYQGVAVAILIDGEVVYQKTHGYKKGQDGAITPDTLFVLGSATKPIAALATLRFAHKRGLDLDAERTVAKLPKPVTLRTILSHSTGYNFSGNAEIEQGKSRADILAKLRQRKDRRHPLSFFRYSNVLYSLVQDVITDSGSSFTSVFHALAQDLGAEGEVTLTAPKDVTCVAYPHTPMREGRPKSQPLPQYYPKVVPAAGGAYASLNGMVKFVKLALGLCPQVMPTGLIQQSYQDVIATNDTGKFRISWPAPDAEIAHAYGLGWRIARLKQLPDQALIYHGGYLKGITPVIAIIPSLNMGIVILVNDESRFSLNMAVQFWRAALVDSGALAV